MPSLREHIEMNTGEPYDPVRVALSNLKARKEREQLQRLQRAQDTIGYFTLACVVILLTIMCGVQLGIKIGNWYITTLAGV